MKLEDLLHNMKFKGILPQDADYVDLIDKCLYLFTQNRFAPPFPYDTSWENVRRYTQRFMEMTEVHGVPNTVVDIETDDAFRRKIAQFIWDGCHGDTSKLEINDDRPWKYGDFMLRFRASRKVGLTGRFPQKFWQKILTRYMPKTIWDPCIGWSDRLYATWSFDPLIRYYGTDISENALLGASNVRNHINANATLFNQSCCEPFELPEKVDLVATCPPYYNIETYKGVPPFPTLQSWYDFLYGMALNAFNNSTDSAHYVVFIGNNSTFDHLVADTIINSQKAGWKIIGADKAQWTISAGGRGKGTADTANVIDNRGTVALHFAKP